MSAMRCGLFSVSYAGLWGQAELSLEQTIAKAAGLGFEGILLMGKQPHLAPLQSDERHLAEVKECLEHWGIEAIGIAAYNDFLLPAPAEIPVEEMQLGYIEACCRAAAFLGGSVVRVFTGYEHTSVTAAAVPVEQGRRTVIRLLRSCGERAARYGITVAVQNHHDLAVESEALNLLLNEVGLSNVRAGYDAWSPFLRGEDICAGATLMAPRTALSIAANYRRFPRYSYEPQLVNYRRRDPDLVRATFMSKGEIDYPPFLRALQAGGYNGWLVYETCSPLIDGSSEEILDDAARDFLTCVQTEIAQ